MQSYAFVLYVEFRFYIVGIAMDADFVWSYVLERGFYQ